MTKTQLKREIVMFRKAAKWRSRVGPQSDALTLWEVVERLENQLKKLKAIERIQ